MPSTDTTHVIPDWVVYPEEEWLKITPGQAGFEEDRFDQVISRLDVRGSSWEGEAHDEGQWGAVLTRGGYLYFTRSGLIHIRRFGNCVSTAWRALTDGLSRGGRGSR